MLRMILQYFNDGFLQKLNFLFLSGNEITSLNVALMFYGITRNVLNQQIKGYHQILFYTFPTIKLQILIETGNNLKSYIFGLHFLAWSSLIILISLTRENLLL